MDPTLGSVSVGCGSDCLSDWEAANEDYSTEEENKYYYSCYYDSYGAVALDKAQLCNFLAPMCNQEDYCL